MYVCSFFDSVFLLKQRSEKNERIFKSARLYFPVLTGLVCPAPLQPPQTRMDTGFAAKHTNQDD